MIINISKPRDLLISYAFIHKSAELLKLNKYLGGYRSSVMYFANVCAEGTPEMVSFIYYHDNPYGKDYKIRPNEFSLFIIDAIMGRNIEVLKWLISEFAEKMSYSIGEKKILGDHSALTWAARIGDIDIINFLFDNNFPMKINDMIYFAADSFKDELKAWISSKKQE